MKLQKVLQDVIATSGGLEKTRVKLRSSVYLGNSQFKKNKQVLITDLHRTVNILMCIVKLQEKAIS